jgi:hypothetical protein
MGVLDFSRLPCPNSRTLSRLPVKALDEAAAAQKKWALAGILNQGDALMKGKTIVLATAAAALFLAGNALAAEGGDKAQVKCEGVNACKNTSACATADSACKGKNACKGKGFVMTKTEAECDELKAKAEDEG